MLVVFCNPYYINRLDLYFFSSLSWIAACNSIVASETKKAKD